MAEVRGHRVVVVMAAAAVAGLVPVVLAADATPPEALDYAVRLPITRPLDAAAAHGPTVDAGRGPVSVVVPSSYDPGSPTPLVMALHGFTSTGGQVEAWMQFAPRAEEYGFLYLFPTGSDDAFGNTFWNATDACCNFFGSDIDDSAYLLALIDVMKAEYNVDARRVYFVGHSNGGFMSYRMACDHADTVAAIASRVKRYRAR